MQEIIEDLFPDSAIFNDDEREMLMLALRNNPGRIETSLENTAIEWMDLLEWAEDARVDAALLNLALQGQVFLRLINGELQVRAKDMPDA